MTGFFDIDLGLGDDVGSARKGKHRINTDVGIDTSFDIGKFSNDDFNLNLGFGSSKGSGGVTDLAKDINAAVDDFKKGYNFMKADIKGIKGGITPGAKLLRGDVQRGVGFLKKRFGKKQRQPSERMHRPTFYVAYVQGGVMRKAQFTNKTQARAFREKYLASGIGDEVSNVIER